MLTMLSIPDELCPRLGITNDPEIFVGNKKIPNPLHRPVMSTQAGVTARLRKMGLAIKSTYTFGLNGQDVRVYVCKEA